MRKLVPIEATPYQIVAMNILAEVMIETVGKIDVALIYATGVNAADDDPLDGLVECQNCGGHFLPGDMNGEHCRECASEIFADD